MLTIPNKLLTKDAVANFSHRSGHGAAAYAYDWAFHRHGKNVTKAEEIVEDIAANHP